MARISALEQTPSNDWVKESASSSSTPVVWMPMRGVAEPAYVLAFADGLAAVDQTDAHQRLEAGDLAAILI